MILLAFLAMPRHAAGQPRYQVTDLGPIQGLVSDLAPGLNSKGDVVLWQQDESKVFAAVLWSGGKSSRLAIPTGYRNGFAYSVNDSGNAVGWANTTLNPVDSFSIVHAVMLNARGVTDLGTLGGNWSRAYAINNHDKIVGASESADRRQRAFQYTQGRMRELAPLPGGESSIAFGLNDAGVVVGGSDAPHSDSVKMLVHAVLWRDGVPKDLGSLSASGSSLAYAVNRREEVVGKADLDGDETAFLYSHGRMTSLGVKNARAFGINDQSQVVGVRQSGEERHPHSHGFLWDKGVVYDLDGCLPPGSPYRIEGAFRINNAGQIAAIGALGGELHVLLLTPEK